MITEAPEKLFPGRARLADARTKYEQAGQGLSELEAKLARLETDEAEVLNNTALDEDEQCSRLVTIRAKKDVQGRRVSHAREEVSKALGVLEAALGPATMELNSLLAVEYSRRREILGARVLKAIEYPEDKPVPQGLAGVVNASPLIWAIRQCEPNPNAWSPLSVEAKATELLGQIERLEAETGRDI